MFYAALDVSLRSVAICIIDQDGKEPSDCEEKRDPRERPRPLDQRA